MEKYTLLIIGIIVFIAGLFILYHAYLVSRQRRKRDREELIQLYSEKQKRAQEIKTLKEEFGRLVQLVQVYQDKIVNLQNTELNIQKEIQEQVDNKEQTIDKFYTKIKQNYDQAYDHYEKTLSQKYDEVDEQFQKKINQIEQQRLQAEQKLAQLKRTIEAATAARLKEQLAAQQKKFYQIQLSDSQLQDIKVLQSWKYDLHNPSIVSKIIWSNYIMKPTSSLCSRVLQTSNSVSGIYKITNTETNEVYIGQSTNISDRWKTHIKYGLGIDTPSTNKLYNNMLKYGVWNYTFEVLQQTTKDKLNERERFWINMYGSNKNGLNTLAGVK